jgi:transcriptional regulator with XRE-family HTH domain
MSIRILVYWTTIVVSVWTQKLGSEIETARHRAQLTQKELATATGLTRNSIGHYERGERAPDLGVLRKIASVLAADQFEIDEGVRVVFAPNGHRPAPVSAEQMTLKFDGSGGVTVRMQPESTGLLIKILSA